MTPFSAAPQSHSLPSGFSPAATFPNPVHAPEPKSEGGWLQRSLPTTRPRAGAGAPAPARSGGRYCVVESYCERRWQNAAIQRGGGRCFPFPAFSLSSHPIPSKRATCPGQSEVGPGVGGRRGQRVVPGHVPAPATRPCWCLERGRVPCPPPRTTPTYQRAAETW